MSKFMEKVPLTVAWMALATSWIVQSEIDRLVGGIMGADHRVFTLAQVQAPGSWRMTEAWQVWATSGYEPTSWFITIYCIVEVLFYLSYLTLAFRLFTAAGRSTAIVAVVLVVEVLETIGMIWAAHATDGMLEVLEVVIVWITSAKWLAIILGIVDFFAHSTSRRWLRGRLRIIALGIRAQRIPFVMLVVVGILGIAYGHETLEQVPDIERGWFEWKAVNIEPILRAGATTFAVAIPLFELARARARRYANLAKGASRVREHAHYVPWLVVAVAPVIVALVLSGTGNGDLVDLPPLLAFSISLAVIAGGSWILHEITKESPESYADWLGDGKPRPVTKAQAATVREAGDLIVGLTLALAILGIVRALAAPAVLSIDQDAFGDTKSEHAIVTIRVVFVLGAIASVLSLAALERARWLIQNHWKWTIPKAKPWVKPAALTSLAIVCLGVILAFALRPTMIPPAAGPLATLTALVGAWSILFGVIVLALDYRMPLDVFRVIRLRSTPVITIAVVAPLILTIIGNAAGNHLVERTTRTELPPRDDLSTALTTWMASKPCALESDEDVIPLIVGAAEGGGIRAATWTVDVYRLIAQERPECAKNVFLSTGASGGSVGLAMFRRTDVDNVAAAAGVDTEGLGKPDGLAATISSALTTDAVAATAGLRIPTVTVADTQAAWHDRAGVMQAQWAHFAPQVDSPYDLQPLAPTGYLVLNSVDASSKCKVVISQVKLVATVASSDRESGACDSKRPGLGATADLLDFEGECALNMNWASAAGLSARFPVISPAGKVDGPGSITGTDCNADSLQLIDGGYVDNSGLGTLSDIAPMLAREIAARNAEAQANGDPVIVPIVMYVSNAPKTDVEGDKTSLVPEAAIPLSSKSQAPTKQVGATGWLARISSDFEGACPANDAICLGKQTAVRERIPSGVVLVAPGTRPTITQPLGWALSGVSRTRLNQEAIDQKNTVTADPDDDHASLGSLLGLFAPTK